MKLDVNRFFIFEIERLPGFPTLAEFIETDAIAKGKAIYHCRFPRSRAAQLLSSHLSAFDNCQSALRDVDLQHFDGFFARTGPSVPRRDTSLIANRIIAIGQKISPRDYAFVASIYGYTLTCTFQIGTHNKTAI